MKAQDITLTRCGKIKVDGKVCGHWWKDCAGDLAAEWVYPNGRSVGAGAPSISLLRAVVKDAILSEYDKYARSVKERNITLTRSGEIKVNGNFYGRWEVSDTGVTAEWRDRKGRFKKAEACCIPELKIKVKEAILAEYAKM